MSWIFTKNDKVTTYLNINDLLEDDLRQLPPLNLPIEFFKHIRNCRIGVRPWTYVLITLNRNITGGEDYGCKWISMDFVVQCYKDANLTEKTGNEFCLKQKRYAYGDRASEISALIKEWLDIEVEIVSDTTREVKEDSFGSVINHNFEKGYILLRVDSTK